MGNVPHRNTTNYSTYLLDILINSFDSNKSFARHQAVTKSVIQYSTKLDGEVVGFLVDLVSVADADDERVFFSPYYFSKSFLIYTTISQRLS